MIKACKTALASALLFTSTLAFAQEREEFGYNINSLRPIRNSDQLFKKTLWWRIDGREKSNKPLFAKNMEITKIIIESVKAGILRPYENDSLKTRMSYETFLQNMTIPSADAGLTDEEKEMGFGTEDDAWGSNGGFGDEGGGDGAKQEAAATEWLPKEIYILEMKEDLIFDKKRSRMYHDIQAITLILPAEKNIAKALDQPIASFSYKELVDNVFKDNPDAVWYNNANPKEHRNLAEAFELRLFTGHLSKFSNGEDLTIEDIYGVGKSGIVASLQVEYDLLDFEAQLWEY
ncbi:MAG: gliding motility protein GldN [Bernardetiaceae bacterium]|jgi:gliding motility associated protien GldN|nr:gliding motility protein GldN [Bernardetiaceae bacterium]